jgi:hypothetical protein
LREIGAMAMERGMRKVYRSSIILKLVPKKGLELEPLCRRERSGSLQAKC